MVELTKRMTKYTSERIAGLASSAICIKPLYFKVYCFGEIDSFNQAIGYIKLTKGLSKIYSKNVKYNRLKRLCLIFEIVIKIRSQYYKLFTAVTDNLGK
jgi:hypothetical protein